MAHKKAGGSTAYGRDSAGQRLGVKLFGGQFAKIGNVIVRQRGTKFYPGINVRIGKDDTLYAVKSGIVEFKEGKMRLSNGTFKIKKSVSVINSGPDKAVK